MTTIHPSSVVRRSPVSRRRRVMWSGLTFDALLLLSAGMASVPGGTASVATVREFYRAHAGVIVVAQLIGLVAATVFAVHARALAGVVPPDRSRRLQATGIIVAVSAGLTAVPVLVLAGAVDGSSDRVVAALTRASDQTDVALFAALSLFAAVVARASNVLWVRALAIGVALLSATRSLLLAYGSSGLDVAAPLGFIVLVAVVSVRGFDRRHQR